MQLEHKNRWMNEPYSEIREVAPREYNYCSSPSHLLYRGVDISLEYKFSNDLQVAPVENYSTGGYEIFILHGSNHFTVFKPPYRFSIPKEGPQTYVRSSCLSGFSQGCNGSTIAVRRKIGLNEWTQYTLGVIESLRYFSGPSKDNHFISFYESIGPITILGAPLTVYSKDWKTLQLNMKKYVLRLDEVEFFFINLVSDISRMIVDHIFFILHLII